MICDGLNWPESAPSRAFSDGQIVLPLILVPSALAGPAAPFALTEAGGRRTGDAEAFGNWCRTGDAEAFGNWPPGGHNDDGLQPGLDDDADVVGGVRTGS
jgi:hypothetical protein